MINHNKTILLNKVKTSEKIVITAHHNPDGDAIGSSLGLYWILANAQKRASVIMPNNFPDFLHWINGTDIIHYYDNDKEKSDALLAEADLIFCLDYNDISRIKGMKESLEASSGYKVLIDHHPEPKNEQFDLIFSKPEASSTSELLFSLFYASEMKEFILLNAAEALYTGIVTDTGGFRHACNHKETFETVAHLIDIGIAPQTINQRIFDVFSESRLRLLGFCLSKRLKILPKYATAYILLTSDDLRKFNFQQGDTEGIVNYGLSIKGINMSVLLTENGNEIRISFRSKTGFSVNDFARNHFNGGGHVNAAGGSSKQSMKETISELKALLPRYETELNSTKDLNI